MNIADRIQYLRKQKGYSQEELADRRPQGRRHRQKTDLQGKRQGNTRFRKSNRYERTF